ncbi:copper resistance CopC family protein [Agromyces arachidis]|uniref:copper resistance CopC family protein n=1 Tax=Agromyces arachidis TaxID=766966 RepID=UPI00405614DE
MTTVPPRNHRLAAIGAALAALVAVGGPALPAFAHNTVVAVSPDGEEVVTEQPGIVWLETNDALLEADGAAAMDVVGPDGRHFATACASVDGPVASVPTELGEPGEYTVVWRVVSADGHPISGEFEFDWAPADGVAVAAGAAESPCAASTDAGGDEGEDTASSGAAQDLVWIGAGVLAVGVAVAVAVLFVRRSRIEAAPSGPGAESGPDDTPEESGPRE